MKKVAYIVIAVVVVGIVAFIAFQRLSPKSPKDVVTHSSNGIELKVEYSRPYKKGRIIFGDVSDQPLLLFGQYWRLGANASTDITFSKNVLFGGKAVAAGTYRMYAVPGAESFQIAHNAEPGISAAHNEPDYSKDVAKIDVPVQAAEETEQLTISFSDSASEINMDIKWDKILLRIPIIPQ